MARIMTDEKRRKISQTKAATAKKRKQQTLKVFELKVNVHHISKEDFKKMSFMFTQGKWAYNDCLSSDDVFKYNYSEHKIIHYLDKDGNSIEKTLDLPSVYHVGVINQLRQNIVNESKAKKKGRKVGALKFKSELNCLPIRTGYCKIINSKTISIPGFRKLKVYGLEQFYGKDYEVANANFVRRPSGFYIMVSICFNYLENDIRQRTGKSVGLDFGIKTNITTSDGDFYNCNVQESEYLKYLQKHLHKKQKNSKHYWKLRNQIQKEYEHLSNKRKDEANKLKSKLFKDYDEIYIQDEQIANWKKFSRGFAKSIHHSYMGSVKEKIVSEIKKYNRGYVLSKWYVSTRYCPSCGAIKNKNEITLGDRIFKCECGYQEDRDVNAAKNIKLFGSTKRAECLEQASTESLASAALEEPTQSRVSNVVSKLDEVKKKDSNIKEN